MISYFKLGLRDALGLLRLTYRWYLRPPLRWYWRQNERALPYVMRAFDAVGRFSEAALPPWGYYSESKRYREIEQMVREQERSEQEQARERIRLAKEGRLNREVTGYTRVFDGKNISYFDWRANAVSVAEAEQALAEVLEADRSIRWALVGEQMKGAVGVAAYEAMRAGRERDFVHASPAQSTVRTWGG